MDIKVKIATPSLDRVIERLGEGERAALNEEMAVELEETIREHVVRYARVHHATAARLNGQRTGNLEDARFAHESGANGAVVTVGASGIRRAPGPLQVIARNRKCLTIPAHGLAYGRRVGQIERAGYAVFRPKGKDYLAIREDGTEVPRRGAGGECQPCAPLGGGGVGSCTSPTRRRCPGILRPFAPPFRTEFGRRVDAALRDGTRLPEAKVLREGQ